jgi:hypothetical protein
MRRAISSLLLVIFSFPLIAQALAWNPAPALPACCRRAGVHHCTMDHHSGSGPQLAQLRCPLFPQPGRISSSTRINAPASSTQTAANQLVGFTTPPKSNLTPLLTLPGSIRKRGPPSFLNSL